MDDVIVGEIPMVTIILWEFLRGRVIKIYLGPLFFNEEVLSRWNSFFKT